MKYLAGTGNENTAEMRMQLKGNTEGDFIDLKTYIQKQERLKINELSIQIKKAVNNHKIIHKENKRYRKA